MFWGRQCLGSVHCLLWSNRFFQYYSHTQTHTHTHIYIYIYIIYISVVIQAVIRFPLYKRFDISRKVRLDNFNFILQTSDSYGDGICSATLPCFVRYPAFFGESDADVLGLAVFFACFHAFFLP